MNATKARLSLWFLPLLADEAFKLFRKDAVKRKGRVNRREMALADYSSWLIEQ